MCEKCVEALKEYYPDLPEEEIADFLMCTTCFPFGSGEDVARQLKDTKENTDGSIGAAYAYADKQIEIAMANLRATPEEEG